MNGQQTLTSAPELVDLVEERQREDKWRPQLRERQWVDRIFSYAMGLSAVAGVAMLGFLLVAVSTEGLEFLSWEFLNSFPSRFAEKAGIKSAIWGSLWLIGLTASIVIPTGLGAAIYLEEFAKPTRFRRWIDVNIANLAAVPSVVYGLLGLTIFVRHLSLGRSLLAAALTMSLLILPIIVTAAREALKAVPQSVRHAAFSLGANRWQTVWAHVLPSATPGALTGIILAISRAIGETAPLIVVGAFSYVAFTPESPMDEFTVLPIQIFNWASRPQAEFHNLAASGIIVLLTVMLLANGAAILMRGYYQKRVRW